jgi:hypothetical protein
VENPQPLSGPHVVAADVPLHVGLAARDATGPVGGADDDDVVADHRSGMETDFAGDRVDFLIVLGLQVHHAVGAEAGNRIPVLRVEGDEAIAGRDVQDAFFTAVGPVRETAAGEHSWRPGAARPFDLAVHPQKLAGGRIERHNRTPRAGCCVEDAVRHERRALEVELGTRAEVLRLEPPGDLEILEIARRDLIERRVAAVAQVGAVRAPFAFRRPTLAHERQRHPGEHACQGNEAQKP